MNSWSTKVYSVSFLEVTLGADSARIKARQILNKLLEFEGRSL